jgi:predicted Zn finger-like uncharacterized protein
MVFDPLTVSLYHWPLHRCEVSMQLVCPNCTSSYSVADGALGEAGRSVRCVRCKHVWFATPAIPEPALMDADSDRSVVHQEPPLSDESAAHSSTTGDAAWPAAEDIGNAVPPPHIDDAPPTAPHDAAEQPENVQEAGAVSDYFAILKRKAALRQVRKMHGRNVSTKWVAAGLACVIAVLVLARENVVRVLPQTASLFSLVGFHVNTRGLGIGVLKTAFETQDGARVLLIEGEIRNLTSTSKDVPNLRFALNNATGAEIYSWTSVPDRKELAAGETQLFRTRLASPPKDGRDARIRFAQPREAAAFPNAAVAPNVTKR